MPPTMLTDAALDSFESGVAPPGLGGACRGPSPSRLVAATKPLGRPFLEVVQLPRPAPPLILGADASHQAKLQHCRHRAELS